MISSRRGSHVLTYLWYSGWMIGVLLALTAVVRLRLGAFGWMFTWQMIGVFALTAVLALSTMLSQNPNIANATNRLLRKIRFQIYRVTGTALIVNRERFIQSSGIAFYISIGAVVMLLDHRTYVMALALAEIGICAALMPQLSRRERIALAVTAAISWILTAGVTYTQLSDWLLNTQASAFAIPGLLVSFGLVSFELLNGSVESQDRRVRYATYAVAAIVFALFALRTDHLNADWVPYHRSYFADVAQFVKDGHWLLHDVPSLYGFLSIATTAAVPAANAWQGLFELTALFMILEGLMVFTILRWGRAGTVNVLFSLLFALAVIFGESVARYDWGGRLYPQGGMRFFWIQGLVFVVFLRYALRENARASLTFLLSGYAIWAISLLWSFENGAWATAVWLPYLIVDAMAKRPTKRDIGLALLQRVSSLIIIIAAVYASVEVFYRVRLGTGPDWKMLAEFTGFFTSGQVRQIFFVQPYGAGWAIVLVLCALGALGIVALRQKRLDVASVVVAAWLAVWASSSYFAVEPLDEYVSLIMPVLGIATAITIFVSREIEIDALPIARISLMPLAIIVIALLIGEPARLAQAKTPLSPGWTFDSTQSMTPISGELKTLMDSAGVADTDPVLIPSGDFWTELSQGLILPFGRDREGKIFLYKSWLPISPVGPQMLSELLTTKRRQHYIDAFLASGQTGWYITYRENASCNRLSPRLRSTRTHHSANFSISYCVLTGS